MRTSPYVPSFYFYKLADALSSSYTSLNAYRSGSIDANGNIIKPESSIDPFEYLVIKLKNIIDQLPYGMTKASLGNVLSAMNYFGEEFQNYDITKDQFDCMMEGIITLKTDNKISYLQLIEDMSVGGGAAGSLGTPMANSSSPTVAGFDPVLQMKLQKRNPKYPKGMEVFEVDPEEFMQFKIAKNWSEVPECENKEYLRRFQRRNKGTKIAVKSLNPLNGEHELHWIEYPAKNFMEEADIELFNFLLENKNELNEERKFTSSPSLRVSVAIDPPKTPERMTAWVENAKVLEMHTPIEGIRPEHQMIERTRRRLIASGFKEVTKEEGKEWSPEILKAGEFAFFNPGQGSDLVVGMPHETKGTHHIGIELKQKSPKTKAGTVEPQYVIPQGTRVPISKRVGSIMSKVVSSIQRSLPGFHKKEPSAEGEEVTYEIDPQEFLGQNIPDNPGGATNKAPFIGGSSRRRTPRRAELVPDPSHEQLRRLTREATDEMLPGLLRSKKEDLSIVGTDKGVTVFHHRDDETEEQQMANKLLEQLGIRVTHSLSDLRHARAPYFGSSIKNVNPE